MKFTGTILFVSAAFLASLVSADPIISITAPLANTRLKAGSEVIIAWVNPSVPTISQIVLAKGKSNALQPLRVIATNVETAGGKYVWKIPVEIDNADDYAFELGTSPDLAFAGPFTIEGGTGGNPAGTSADATPNAVPAASPASPASPAGGNAAAPAAAPASPAGGSSPTAASPASSGTSAHNANSSHAASAGIKQTAGQSVIAAGVVAAIASQFF
ncbi:hypothetical protein BDF21DRAFT_443157 [Thamnidium elegans]|uniref:Yeast cell wall synthesis Kre9/Knh1-like N-terminal domain-containing protein n=1 Tax=Thamnidium elegans TaxID=101142 RepID=A0A8H7T069_9FUNG|nr:hypothetical protein INT48_004578 [Thamnidium elegans]KAI8088129.1 hypothetical protein BDF21DRAFT_443157 [Thamnidium elegans]